MLVLNYLKPKNCLPDPLSLCLLSQAIALANNKVTKATKDKKKNVANTRSLAEMST